jgi:hypothetical protein
VNNIHSFPELDIINISGQEVFSYYLFWNAMKGYLELPGKLVPRMNALKEATPRPYRAGLEIKQAKKIGVPLYSLKDGFELIKRGI